MPVMMFGLETAEEIIIPDFIRTLLQRMNDFGILGKLIFTLCAKILAPPYFIDNLFFYQISFHEMGYYDLPAVIDYILNVTQTDKLYYVGHSMGTTMFFVMASTRPEYNKKIRLFSGMAPVTCMSKQNMEPRKRTLFDTVEKMLVRTQILETTSIIAKIN